MQMRVIIVDDHAAFRASARTLLEVEGFDVVGEAEDGAGAIAATDALRPDVVLLDVALPDMSGLDVAERLTTSSPVAVVLTSSRDPGDLGPRLARSGARGFIPKDRLSRATLAPLLR